MIRLEGISTDCFSGLDFEVRPGDVCSIITHSHFDSAELIDTILSLRRPVSGKVFLFEQDLYQLPDEEQLKLYQRVGIVWSSGGLISNLKVRENLALPLWYHKAEGTDLIESKIIKNFEMIGVSPAALTDYMGKLPGPLPIHEKRIIAMVRAMMMEPDLMIYDSTFEGLNRQKVRSLMKMTTSFHEAAAGRTSIYITSDEDSVEGLDADLTLKQEERTFV